MGLPSDFNKQTTVTISLLIWIAGVSFSMGMIYKSIIDNDKEHTQIHTKVSDKYNRAIEFTDQEVGGLRADVDKQDKIHTKEIDRLIKRVDELEKDKR